MCRNERASARGAASALLHSAFARVIGVRRFLDAAGTDPRVDGTAVQTVGSKGHDGFALLVVRARA